ncbi:hypothetical protein NDK47_21180 [Brevibacillus ruminantium]|uniref:Uncharacterized protein n=1 Tax=Brevibacillus ruminantium TaxID=2950604 RepID=A0ABY4WBS2_9BACL|nr:hypothetical protein [Brevibacillus ruminantium]USG64632.1 hypothetical protein NDK47_21180 [Brevibacillus ruminantium]
MANKTEQFHNFIGDLILLVQEKYNGSLENEKDEDELEKAFRLGSNIAYYDVLELIHSQLEAFGFDSNRFGVVSPTPGEKLNK